MKRVIIERPDLQSPLQRAATGGITFVFWVFWIYLWLPLISLVAWLIGVKLFRENIIDNDGYKTLLHDVGWYALIIALIAVVQISWGRYNLLRFRDKELRKSTNPVDLATRARAFKIDPQRLEQWQAAKYLVIHHDPRGDITAVDIARPAAGQSVES
jgi:biofilm PGA synthesis protein PgaD